MPEKKCSKCEGVKPLDEFHRDKNRKDGRHPHCKECSKEAKDIYRQNNKEKLKERPKRVKK